MIEVPFLIDAHLDLATNAMILNRDLTQPVHAIRAKERTLKWDDFPDRGRGTVALPELREGGVGLVWATMISRYSEYGSRLKTLALPGWHSPEQAYANAMGQLAWYREMERRREMVQIRNLRDLATHTENYRRRSGAKLPIGYILALEGADSIVTLDHLHWYYEQGLRSIGPAHFGPGRYAAGTHSDGSGLTASGRELLREMNQLRLLLDVTHLTDRGFFEALDIYEGPLLASHQNCRALVAGERQFSDDQLRAVIGRGGVIGGSLDTWMLYPEFKMNGDDPRTLGIDLEKIVDHWDHICQLAGNADHVGIGSDLDGLFGTEQTPYDMDTIADLHKIAPLLRKRGYVQRDIYKILFGNFFRLLKTALPA
jgi:membrane dipeptidase